MHLIGAAAALSGVHTETIRYYERAGIVPRAARTASGRRRYTEEDIARPRFVRRCRDLGFSIPDIRTLLGLAEDSEPPLASTKILGALRTEVYDNAVRVDSAAHALLAALKTLLPLDLRAAEAP